MKRKRQPGLLRAAAAVGLAILSACSHRPPRQAVLVLLDAARPDHFSCYGYPKPTTPEIDALAEEGALFLNCFTQGTTTRTALPCLIYSRYFAPSIFPHHRYVPLFSPEELFEAIDESCLSLPRALERAGFLTAAVSAHDWINPQTQFAKEFGELHELISIIGADDRFGYPPATRVVDYALEWIRKHRKKDFFLYIHVMDTHFPHPLGEDSQAFLQGEEYDPRPFDERGFPLDEDAFHSPQAIAYLNGLYDGSLRSADRQVGRLIEGLRKEGLLEGMVLAVTADHGEVLLDRPGQFGHGGKWYEPVAHIPLILHCPQKIRPQRWTGLCEMVDIAPTLLGLLGVPYPEGKEPDGVDLTAVLKGLAASKQEVYIGSGIRTERWKLLLNDPPRRLLEKTAPDGAKPEGELYDLATDPHELLNRLGEEPGAAADLFHRYRARLGPLLRRFEAAVRRGPVSTPFAVSAVAFRTEQPLPPVSFKTKPARILELESPSGWFRSPNSDYFWLFAKPNAKPVTISFPVPSGRYFLRADINGGCTMTVGRETKFLRSGTFNPEMPWPLSPVDFGPVDIESDIFSAAVSPRGPDPWFAVRLLSFDPVIEGKVEGLDAQKRLKRLKTLGYVK